jgi:hypothetical protein
MLEGKLTFALMRCSMKLNAKFSLYLLVLASMALACNAEAALSESTNLMAEYGSNVELVLEMQEELDLQEAAPGKEGLAGGTVVIRANVDWELQAMARPSRMQRGTNSQNKLKNSLRILYPTSDLPACVTLSPGEISLTGSYVRHLSGGPGEAVIPLDFRQQFDWTDVPDRYNIKLYFRLLPL